MAKNRTYHKPAALAPKPVRMAPIKNHALFGRSLREHMMIDDSWKTQDLIEQYKDITVLLNRNFEYQKLQKKLQLRDLSRKNKKLQTEVHDGRKILNNKLVGDVRHEIRLILNNHKDMQRLYAQMPMYDVIENVYQKTFRLQKERDRYHYQLERMLKDMERIKMNKASMEDRLGYLNMLNLQHELNARELRKQLQNSQARLQAMQTINSTYKKILKVLKSDEKFHEPILDSLNKDVEDQQTFIDNIIHLGLPAIDRLNELKHESWLIYDTQQKHRQSKSAWLSEMERVSMKATRASTNRVTRPLEAWRKKYVRETSSMLRIKAQLQSLEQEIRMVQEATLCSRPCTIVPTFKQQHQLNSRLEKIIALEELNDGYHEIKVQISAGKKQSVLDEISKSSQQREARIKQLKELIAAEELEEEQSLNKIKESAKLSVLLRCGLWNLYDIVRHVHWKPEPSVKHQDYLNPYMKLPLLKFELFDMKAVPPKNYEENTTTILKIVTEKLRKLMTAHKDLISSYGRDDHKSVIEEHQIQYGEEFFEINRMDDKIMGILDDDLDESKVPFDSPKPDSSIPTRAFIKTESSSIVNKYSSIDY